MKRLIALLAIIATTSQAGTMTLIYTADNGNVTTGRVKIAQSRGIAAVDKVDPAGGPAAKIMRNSMAALRDYWRSIILASEQSDRNKAALDADAAADKTDPTEDAP